MSNDSMLLNMGASWRRCGFESGLRLRDTGYGERTMSNDGLRRGDLVEVRSPAEILATLDERGALDELPFMPEMVAFCGRRFCVDRRAEKICDTVHYTGSRRLPDTVLLADLRCDGSAHGGCQAECRFFWKEAWLRKVTPDSPRPGPARRARTARRSSTRVIAIREARRGCGRDALRSAGAARPPSSPRPPSTSSSGTRAPT